jgi:hypothetical protein
VFDVRGVGAMNDVRGVGAMKFKSKGGEQQQTNQLFLFLCINTTRELFFLRPHEMRSDSLVVPSRQTLGFS